MRQTSRLICTGLLALAVLLIGSWLSVCGQTRGRVSSDVNDLPCRSVGLVLGCPPCTPTGRPNLYFRYRMEAAERLFKAGKVNTLLLSGMRAERWDELSCMRRALVEAGVPAEALLLDCGSERTMGSILRCREVFHETSVVVVSQASHVRRAVFSASHLGINAIGYVAEDVDVVRGLRLRIREAVSRLKAVAEILLAKVWFEGLRSTVNMGSQPCALTDELPCCFDPLRSVQDSP